MHSDYQLPLLYIICMRNDHTEYFPAFVLSCLPIIRPVILKRFYSYAHPVRMELEHAIQCLNFIEFNETY